MVLLDDNSLMPVLVFAHNIHKQSLVYAGRYPSQIDINCHTPTVHIFGKECICLEVLCLADVHAFQLVSLSLQAQWR